MLDAGFVGVARHGLLRSPAQPSEVLDEFLEVIRGVDAEPVPYISQYHCSPEAQVFDTWQVVQCHTAECHHLFVDYLGRCHLAQGRLGEVGRIVRFGNAVENGGEEKIVASLLVGFHLVGRVAGAGYVSFVLGGKLRVAVVEMNAFEAVF